MFARCGDRLLSALNDLDQAPALGFADGHLGWNYPSWTLGLEFWLNIGFVYFVVQNVQKKPHKEGAMMAMLFVLFSLSIFFIRFGKGNFDIHFQQIFTFTNIGVVRCLIGFLIGILVYYASIGRLALRISKSKSYIFLCETLLLFLLFLSLCDGGQSWAFLAVFLVFPLVIFIAAVRQKISILNTFCSLPIVRELGNFSYGIYLLHVPVLYLLAMFEWYQEKNSHLQLAILCGIVFVVSIPVYYLYEVKAKKFLIEKLS
jgi:peptidoglycan/LPS O-acetylase OafA/YrhL